MKKFLKISMITLGVFFLVGLGSLIYVFIKLPEPAEIANKIPATPPTAASEVKTASLVEENKVIDAPAAQEENSSQAEAAVERTEKVMNEQIGNEIFNYNRPISTTCENLTKAPTSSFKKETDFIKAFQDAFGNDVDDPFLQSFLAPLKKATRFPKMKAFFEEVSLYKTANGINKEAGILEKGYFYLKALDAVREIKSNRQDLNVTSDRAYKMYALTKAIQKKPELAQDKAVTDYCDQLQASLENASEHDSQEENAEFLKFLDYAGVDSKDVGYNPAMKTDFKIELKDNTLHMGLGWMGEAMSR